MRMISPDANENGVIQLSMINVTDLTGVVPTDAWQAYRRLSVALIKCCLVSFHIAKFLSDERPRSVLVLHFKMLIKAGRNHYGSCT